jgi:2-amino-4-hydroxy-6-hydroxymethyldihydropteridine diphosphokinase
MARVVLGLGSNLGARAALLRAAVALFEAQPGLKVLARSLVYETAPLGPPQPHYLNAALLVEWAGSLPALFATTCHVEQLLGRERRERWGARTLDVDILLWSGGPVETAELTVPHPGAFVRPFVLAPMRDVLPALASELSARLSELGVAAGAGRPLLDEALGASSYPGECVVDDLAELLSAAAGELVDDAARVPCRAALPFQLPSGPVRAVDALVRQVCALPTLGFSLQRAAVTHQSDEGFRGVFLGEHGPSRRPPTAAHAHFFATSERMWVRVSRSPA